MNRNKTLIVINFMT